MTTNWLTTNWPHREEAFQRVVFEQGCRACLSGRRCKAGKGAGGFSGLRGGRNGGSAIRLTFGVRDALAIVVA